MKICIINNILKPYSRGGADKVADLIIEGLKKEGHDVFGISTKPGKDKVNGKYYINSVFIFLYKIPLLFRFFWHFYDLFNVKNFIKINHILKKEKPDLVITHNLKGLGLLSCRAIKKNRIKHIHVLHDIQLLHPSGLMIYRQEKKIDTLPAKIYSLLSSFIIKSPDIIISPSRWLLKMHTDRNFFKKSNKKIILNPLDCEKNNLKKNNILNNKKNNIFKFLYVGELEEQKGIILAIQSFLDLDQKIKNKSELIIVGAGNQIKKISDLAKNHNQIKILGWVENEKVKTIMKNSDLLLVPSICYDNSPTVIYEAAKNGLPILAANIGGIPELIEKFNGELFEPGNKKDLTQKMVKSYLSSNKKINSKSSLEELEIKNYLKRLLED